MVSRTKGKIACSSGDVLRCAVVVLAMFAVCKLMQFETWTLRSAQQQPDWRLTTGTQEILATRAWYITMRAESPLDVILPTESPTALPVVDQAQADDWNNASSVQGFAEKDLPMVELPMASDGGLSEQLLADGLELLGGTDAFKDDKDDDSEERTAAGTDDGVQRGSSCNDVHPNADSPDMLHVVFASDLSQVEGVQASVASVVSAAAEPELLTVHIIVQEKWVKDFKQQFGLRPACHGTVTVTGVLIKVHAIDGTLIQKAVATVSASVKKERGFIDSVENFARFYMYHVLGTAVVVYLDADTIVQADLAQLRKELLDSKKTIGFVKRDVPESMSRFLKRPKGCKVPYSNWKKLQGMPAYNVGVFVVNLQRWVERRITQKVEAWVSAHNKCGGTLWVGGSQPPLLLAFLDRAPNTPEDFIVLDSAWNAGGLGWRENLNIEKIKKKHVLHWNGKAKPWNPD
eukprot:4595638-Amphidinium_carterae.1